MDQIMFWALLGLLALPYVAVFALYLYAKKVDPNDDGVPVGYLFGVGFSQNSVKSGAGENNSQQPHGASGDAK